MDTEKTEKIRGKNGGRRPGSGRKKKLVKFATENDYFNALVDEDFDDFYASLKALGLGVRIEEEREDGVVAFSKAPDGRTLQYIFDRRLGKPIESVDHTTKGEKITGINYIVPNENNNST